MTIGAGQQRSLCALVLAALTLALAGCASKPPSKQTPSGARSGAYYKDDGPPSALPSDLDRIPDAQPRDEPLHRFANRPYNVFGVNYTPLTLHAPLVQRGVASWYGRKFHGQKTAIGETYDMLAMTAAHPTAPIPSYARVTNPRNNRSVVVRVNDRGPFHAGRIVDLSYAAAHKIGIAQAGSGEVVFELLIPPHFASGATAAAIAAAPAQSRSAVSATSDESRVSAPSISPQSNRGEQQFFVQLGAFGNFANAQAFQSTMNNDLGSLPVVRQVAGLFRVQLGPYASEAEARAARDAAQSRVSPNGGALPIVTEPLP
jgi:rare lipoprotein A